MEKFKIDKKVSYTYSEEDKKKLKFKELKPYLSYYKRHAGLMFICLLFMLISMAIGIISPILTGKLIASFTAKFNASTTLKYALFILGLEVCSTPIYYLLDVFWNKCQVYVRYDMSKDIINHVNNIKIICFDNNSTSKFTSRIFSDISYIALFPLNILNYVTNIISKLGFIVYTLSLSIEIGLFMIGYIIFSLITEFARLNMRLKHNKILKNYSEKEDNIQYENIRGMRDVRALNSTNNVLNEIDKKYRFKASLGYKYSIKNSNIKYINIFMKSIIYFLFLYLGIHLISTGKIEVAAFIIAYNYHNSISLFATNIIGIKSYSTEVLLSASRVNELYNDEKFPTEVFGSKSIKNVKGNIKFQNVSFSYNKDIPVLKNISFEIKPNTIVSFVGKSGSGKSTIASLLSKLYYLNDENSGTILIDDININDLSKDTIRDNICLVSQSPYIFDMTIAENLRLANPNATDSELDEVLKFSELYDFVYSQPNKLDTKLGENGTKLSGGQKQRLAISRALLKKSKIIIFDEATSALDNENQEKIKNIMKNMTKEHTIIMIAHRLSTVVDSDNIIFIKDGTVHAQGTHKSLMKTCIDYKNLYSMEEKNTKEEQD